MNIDEQYPSKYLAAADIPDDGDLVLTIKDVGIENVGKDGQEESKPIVYFQEVKKGLLCNRTNANTIKGMYTAETDEWIGKRIALFSTEVDFQGRQTLAIRVRLKAPKAAATPTNGQNESKLWQRWYQLVQEAAAVDVAAPNLDAAASDADVLAAGKALKAQIAQAKELAAAGL